MTIGQLVLRPSCSVAFKNFVLAFCDVFFGLTTPGMEVITKLMWRTSATSRYQPLFAFMPKAL
jgi:hypothetical protein